MSKVAITGNASGAGVFTIASPNSATDRTLTLPDETGTIALAQASYVRLNSPNGYGSTNNKIRRFTNVVNNVGPDITYADSATLGATFTINTDGVYSVSTSGNFDGGNTLGLSINSTQLTSSINAIDIGDVLAIGQTAGASLSTTISAVFYAASGAVVRVHNSGAVNGAGAQTHQFTIARVA